MEESFVNTTTDDERLSATSNRADDPLADSLVNMSKEEMTQHLKFCMKLAAENKINVKNAFGLHLIGIMRHLIKHETPDLQFASLSLQASTKIYAGRVEALYKDTCQFHSHLQTIVTQGRNAPTSQGNENQDDDSDDEGRSRRTQRTKRKSYISSEEGVNIQTNAEKKTLSMPHGNFIAIKSAFCASRTTQKLLEALPIDSDNCRIYCGTPAPCYNNRTEANEAVSSFPQKMCGLFEKLRDLHISAELTSMVSAPDVFSLRQSRSPRPSAFNEPPDFSFAIGNDPASPAENEGAVSSIINRFSVMDITANDFVNDIAQAVTSGNTINRMLLPPKSALKKVLRENLLWVPVHLKQPEKRRK